MVELVQVQLEIDMALIKEEIIPHLSKPEQEVVMTLAERLREEGREQGIEKGIEKGIERGIEKGIEKAKADSALKVGSKGFGKLEDQTIAKINQLSVEALDVLLINVFEATSQEEWIQGV